MKERMQKRGHAGFTLLEVMVVVILMAMMAAFAGGYYLRSQKRWQVERTSQELFLLLRYARVAAIERQATCKAYLDQTANRVWLTSYTENEEGGREEVVLENRFSRPVELPEHVQFMKIELKRLEQARENNETEAEESEADIITFRPDGTADQALIILGDTLTFFSITLDSVSGRAVCHSGIMDSLPQQVMDLDRGER